MVPSFLCVLAPIPHEVLPSKVPFYIPSFWSSYRVFLIRGYVLTLKNSELLRGHQAWRGEVYTEFSNRDNGPPLGQASSFSPAFLRHLNILYTVTQVLETPRKLLAHHGCFCHYFFSRNSEAMPILPHFLSDLELVPSLVSLLLFFSTEVEFQELSFHTGVSQAIPKASSPSYVT